MVRIFLTLSIASTVLMAIAFFLGLEIDDPRVRDQAVQAGVSRHMLTGLATLCFTTLVHSIVFTYFMGTGRWIEETSRVYQLDAGYHRRNQQIKYRLLPGIVGTVLLVVLTGAFGGAADPGSPVGFQGLAGVSPATLHLVIASAAGLCHLLACRHEFHSIEQNSEIIEAILVDVRRIRTARGLPV